MKVSVVPKSDQWNADDFLGGPRSFTVTGAQPRKDDPERFEVTLAESNTKVWRPPNGMASVLIQLWGNDSKLWNGKRVTLFTDPSVKFGKETPGGIRISHMSDIGDSPVTVKIRVQRGRRGPYTVQPLIESAPVVPDDVRQNAEQAKAGGNLASYRDYLQAQNAPAHIMQYIDSLGEQAHG